MYQEVFIQSVNEDGSATVGCSLNSCRGCKASLFCTSRNQSFEAANPDKLPIKPFDKVEIYLPPAKTVGSTLLVLGLPLACFPIGYALSPFASVYADAAVGLGAMALCFGLTAVFTRSHAKSLRPLITRILGKEEDHA